MATKAMTMFRSNGEDFTINDPNITDEFDSTAAYAIGDYAYYQGNLYRFKAAHAAGAWNSSHVSRVFVGEELNRKTSEMKNVSTPNVDDYGYTRYYMGAPTADKMLRSTDGTIVNGAGTGNNYAFERFVRIPMGKIYFAFPYSDDGYNVVFYDEKWNVVDTIGTESSMTSLYGREYDNTAAAYMRVGGYKVGGYTEYSECYVYTMPDATFVRGNRIIPRLRNTATNGSTRSEKSLFQTDFFHADKPIHIYSKDLTKYVVGILVYDDNNQQDSGACWYVSDMKTKTGGVCIPSGRNVKVNIIEKDAGSISATDDVLDTIVIEQIEDNMGYGSIKADAYFINYGTGRLTTIDKVYADEETFITHEESAAVINLAIYDSNAYDAVPVYSYFYDAGDGKIVRQVPKGFWYRYSVGYNGSTMQKSDLNKLIIYKAKHKRERENNLYWKTRVQNDRDVFPDYYDEHIEEKCADIRELEGDGVVQFAFITDYHYGTQDNTNNSRQLLTRIVKRTKVGIVFNGGDTWTRGNDEETPDTLEESKDRILHGLDETIPNYPCNWYFVLGNHDTGLDYWVHDGITETFGPMVTTDELSNYVGGCVSDYDVVYDPNGYGFAYFFDVGNFRFIVTNAGERDDGGLEASLYQKIFMAKALLGMGSKTAIIIGHKYLNARTSENPGWEVTAILDVIAAYNARGTYSLQSNVQSVNFANCQGKIACYIAGHTHMDLKRTTSDGIPVFMTTTANAGAGRIAGETRVNGTITENAFDVFTVDSVNKTVYATRIGAGEDRSAEYDQT